MNILHGVIIHCFQIISFNSPQQNSLHEKLQKLLFQNPMQKYPQMKNATAQF